VTATSAISSIIRSTVVSLASKPLNRDKEIPMPTSRPDGFLAASALGHGTGVLVLHPWWGLNDTIKSFCTRLASSGFTVFAPDLYHGRVAQTIPEAKALASSLDDDLANSEVLQAAVFLHEQPGVAPTGLAVVGFSLGAFLALSLSNSDPEHIRKVVIFYGTGPEDFSRSKAEYLGHFAVSDEYEPASAVDALEASLRQAGRPVVFYRYEGTGHWFFEADRKDAFHEASARLAWERTLTFLGGPSQ
jgi:carboxymethylenebutenolidase